MDTLDIKEGGLTVDPNERESIANEVAKLEATIESCNRNVEEGDARAKAFRAKRTRCKQELAALNRKLRAGEE